MEKLIYSIKQIFNLKDSVVVETDKYGKFIIKENTIERFDIRNNIEETVLKFNKLKIEEAIEWVNNYEYMLSKTTLDGIWSEYRYHEPRCWKYRKGEDRSAEYHDSQFSEYEMLISTLM